MRGGAPALAAGHRLSPSAGPGRPRPRGALAPGLVAPFDAATVLGGDVLDLCSLWPQSTRDPTPGPGPLPDVATLLVEGGADLRTPVETATQVAAGLPRAKLVTIPAVGHSPGSAGVSGCAEGLAVRFFSGRRVPSSCRAVRTPAPTGVPPGSLRGRSPSAAVGLTIDDVVQDVAFSDDRGRGVGLRSGRAT